MQSVSSIMNAGDEGSHDITVYVYRINRIGYPNAIVVAKDITDISCVTFCSIIYKHFRRAKLNASRSIVMYTIVVWMGDDVNGKELKEHQYVPGQEGYRQANYNYAWYNNPYFAAEELQQIENRDVVNGQLCLNYQLMPNFNIQGRAAMRQQTALQEMKVPKTYMNYGDSRAGDYKVWNNRQTNVDADLLATYTRDLTSDILFTLNAGTSMFYRNYRQEYQSTDGLIVPYVYSIKNTQGPSITDANRTEKSIRSVYGSVNLDFSKYAYLTLTGRNDWSSTLAKGNNSYFYPSVAVSTMLSEYIKLPKAIDYMKLYGSWIREKGNKDRINACTYPGSFLKEK